MTIPKKSKRVLVGVTVAAVAFLLLAAVAPLVFKDQVVKALRTQFDESLEAQLEFSDISLSLLRSFPQLSASVNEIRISGIGPFEGVPLVNANALHVDIDVIALVRDDAIEISGLELDRPVANLIVNEDGRANYDIVKPSVDSEPSNLQLNVDDYDINDGKITYTTPTMIVRALDLNHQGSATIDGATQRLSSETKATIESIQLSGSEYLRDLGLGVELTANIDGDAKKAVFEKADISINSLEVQTNGSLAWSGESPRIDIDIASGENTSIKGLLSLLPNAKAADFNGLKAEGLLTIKGNIKGEIAEEPGLYPAVKMNVSIRDGGFKYPDLPLAVSNLQLQADVEHPGGELNKLTVVVPQLSARAGKSSVTGRLNFAEPVSGPRIDLSATGNVNLEDLAGAYPIADVEKLSGRAKGNIDLRSRGDTITALTGKLTANDVSVSTKSMAPLNVSAMTLRLTPNATKVDDLALTIGASDLRGSGTLSPFTNFVRENKTIRGDLTVKSNNIRVADFSSTTADKSASTTNSPLSFPPNLDIALNTKIQQLTYDDVKLANVRGKARLKNRSLKLDKVMADTLGGVAELDGAINTPENAPPNFDFTFAVKKAEFRKAYDSLNAVKTFLPISKFMTGTFSTATSAKGTLGKDSLPNLNSLGATGVLEAAAGSVKDFPPLRILAKAVPRVPENLKFKNLKTYFSLTDGAVNVDDFPVDAGKVQMTVGGRHGLNNEMKYRIRAQIPRANLQSMGLAKQAAKLGLNLSEEASVGVVANISGSITSPKVSIELDADQIKSTLKDAAEAKISDAKAKATQALSEQAEKLIAEATARADKIRSRAKAAADKLVAEGNKRADKLEAEGEGNPLKRIAADRAASALRKQTKKRSQDVLDAAEKSASKIEDEARAQADRLSQP